MPEPRIWHLADTHFRHRNCGVKWRGFDTIEDHDQHIIDRCRTLIAPGDTVIHHGDVGMGSTTAILDLAARIPGRLELVAGNHDPCHPMNRGPRWTPGKWDRILAKWGEVFATVTVLDWREIAGQPVMMSHLPYAGDHTAEDRCSRWRPRDEGDWLLCAHVHAAWLIHGRQVNVGVDQWGMGPVPEDLLRHVIAGVEAPGELYVIRERWLAETGARAPVGV